MIENTNPVEPPHDEKYHLTEDMADKAIAWMKKHRAFSPDKPFLMYWAPGAAHGPHHVFPAWADKYKGQFNDGWDALREKTFKRWKNRDSKGRVEVASSLAMTAIFIIEAQADKDGKQ